MLAVSSRVLSSKQIVPARPYSTSPYPLSLPLPPPSTSHPRPTHPTLKIKHRLNDEIKSQRTSQLTPTSLTWSSSLSATKLARSTRTPRSIVNLLRCRMSHPLPPPFPHICLSFRPKGVPTHQGCQTGDDIQGYGYLQQIIASS